MKAFVTLIVLFVSGQIYGQSIDCNSLYLNSGGSTPSKIEKNAKKILSEKVLFREAELTNINLYSDSKNIEGRFKANSIIIDLNSETDFTGSEVNVSIYKVNEDNEIRFLGNHMESKKYFKTRTLVNIAVIALNLSCGRESNI